jgi:hypothetical protein
LQAAPNFVALAILSPALWLRLCCSVALTILSSAILAGNVELHILKRYESKSPSRARANLSIADNPSKLLRAAGLKREITAVTITGGDRETGRGSLNVKVPKRDLISGLQLALEKGELRIARRMKEVGSLVRELMEVRGEHDDLVIALTLACWRAKRKMNNFGGEGRLL